MFGFLKSGTNALLGLDISSTTIKLLELSKSGPDSKYHPLGSGNTQSVTVIEAGDRTRVIVAMTELVAYNAYVEGNTLYVLVGKEDVAGFVEESPDAIVAESEAEEEMVDAEEQIGVTSVTDIDFRRGEQGEGRVIVTLSDPGIGVDISSEGGKIMVEFSNTQLPRALQRRLDVTDFATPVLIVDALPEAGNTILTIEPTGDYDYLAYQADNVFTLEVKPMSADELASARDMAFRFTGEKLSFNFQDIEARAVLQLIADVTDMNLVASDTVAGRITLRLRNVPVDQALDIIMKTMGLAKREIGNVLMVAPAAELAAREKMEMESQQQISELAPLRTEFIEVRYANAATIFGLFESGGESDGVVSSRGNVIVDERTNSIILTETREKINQFRAVLEKLDVPVRQVLIEARIVTASSNFSESLGVSWGGLGFGTYNDDTIATSVGGSLTTLGEIRDADEEGITFTSPDHLIVDLGIGAETATSVAVGLLKENYLLELELSALVSEGHAEVIARPKVITADKQQAVISSGVEIPYQEASSSGATSTQFKSATLSLDVKPQITPDDRIIMELNVTQNTVGAVFNGVPSINTNSIQTQVLVHNGETIVLGGIFTTQVTESTTKTPFFGDLPYVGRFFRRTTESDDKQELLIFITPRLIRESLTSR
ncbi:MAG: type IV pilus secretin PilQ family protein [Pseudomonadales bacterium]|jgi:type IV pilus assembly protein PilQ|nr:type IV pilus secretin PilQ family protein [Pseudomonadales bacterium]MDP7595353.1 type IV pilus secretin PilQ family protein [Pseudomonadales bacterium]HJN52523.1 type IV pilus secretin PilQ family protein [Pseudomonadales bacterium]